MLDGAAAQCLVSEVERRVSNWGDAMRPFAERYSSPAKQDCILRRLDENRISQFETGSDISEAQALRATVDEIDRLTPMSHPEDSTDRAKMLHLQKVVLEREWARTVLSTFSSRQQK